MSIKTSDHISDNIFDEIDLVNDIKKNLGQYICYKNKNILYMYNEIHDIGFSLSIAKIKRFPKNINEQIKKRKPLKKLPNKPYVGLQVYVNSGDEWFGGLAIITKIEPYSYNNGEDYYISVKEIPGVRFTYAYIKEQYENRKHRYGMIHASLDKR